MEETDETNEINLPEKRKLIKIPSCEEEIQKKNKINLKYLFSFI